MHLISHQSAISGHSDLQHAADTSQLPGVDSSFSQFPTELMKEGTNYFYKASTEKSSPYLLFLAVEAMTVDRVRRPTEMHHGILYL